MSGFLTGRTSLTTVQTGDIAADAVTAAKLPDDVIDSEHYAAGSIDSAHLADDAVTLAKMVSATDGVILTYDASGNPVHVGPGSDGEVLTSTGAGSPPAFEAAAGGGAWTLIGTSVASDSASLTITGLDSTYDTYAIALSNIVPSVDSFDIYLRVGDSSGIDSGSTDYKEHIDRNGQSTTYSANYSTGIAQIHLAWYDGVGNAAGEGFGAILYLHRPGDGSMKPFITGHRYFNVPSGNFQAGLISAERAAVIVLDRVQLLPQGGNLAEGRMTIWGISHT